MRRRFRIPVTAAICVMACAVWAVSNSPDSYSVSVGSLFEGRVWTLFSHVLFHSRFNHLFYDVVELILVGAFLEPQLVRRQYLLVLLVSILGSAMAFLFLSPNGSLVGLSGLIHGLVGAFIGVNSRGEYQRAAFVLLCVFSLKIVGEFFGISASHLLPSLLAAVPDGRIAHSAHAGGFVAGLLCGFFINRSQLVGVPRVTL